MPHLLGHLGPRRPGPAHPQHPPADPRAGHPPRDRRRIHRVPRGAHHRQAGAGSHCPDRRADPLQPGHQGQRWAHRPRLPGRPAHDLRRHHRRAAQPVRRAGRGGRPLARDAHAGLPGPVRGPDPRPVRGTRGEAVLHGLLRAVPGRGHGRPRAARRPPPLQAQGRRPDHRGPGHPGPLRDGRPRRVTRARGGDRIVGSARLRGPLGSLTADRHDELHPDVAAVVTAVRHARAGRSGARERLRGRLSRRQHTAARPAAALRGRPDGADEHAVRHPGHRGHSAGRQRRKHLGQLAGPVSAAGRRGAPVGLRPASGHGIQHPGLRQFGHRRVWRT